ncbi:MAG: ORF6N domain-containing protein [Bacteroidaceae bacterium]|nr:ORF6N domain-containing protein [Bacteroidaceae bacterium]
MRGQQVLLDRDVAVLYGVETKAVNQTVKNNSEKFPRGYLFVLTDDEKHELVKNFDRFGKFL